MFFFVDEMSNSIVSFFGMQSAACGVLSSRVLRATRLGFGRELFSDGMGRCILSYTTILLLPVAGLEPSISSFLGGRGRAGGDSMSRVMTFLLITLSVREAPAGETDVRWERIGREVG